MKVGITGTRQGPNAVQAKLLKFYLMMFLDVDEIHHGDCVGVDDFADSIAIKMGVPRVIYPPDNPKFRAFCADKLEGVVKEVMPKMPYLARNRNLVEHVDAIIACPLDDEDTRGGTWHTVMCARKRGIPTIVIRREKLKEEELQGVTLESRTVPS